MKPPAESRDPAPALADPAALMTQALARLERSRANLRLALTPALPAQDRAPTWSSALVEHARAWLRGTTWGTVVEPLVGAACDTLSAWWTHQPWRLAALQARDTLSAELSPWVRRHPVAAIAVSAVVGATVAASGVWRWPRLRRTALHLAAQLRRTVTGQLSSPALQSVLLGAVLSYLAARKPPDRPAPPQAPASTDAADAAAAAAAAVSADQSSKTR